MVWVERHDSYLHKKSLYRGSHAKLTVWTRYLKALIASISPKRMTIIRLKMFGCSQTFAALFDSNAVEVSS